MHEDSLHKAYRSKSVHRESTSQRSESRGKQKMSQVSHIVRFVSHPCNSMRKSSSPFGGKTRTGFIVLGSARATRGFRARRRPCSGRRRRDACFEGLRPGKQREDALMYTAMFGNMPDPDAEKMNIGWEYWQQPVDTQKARVAVEGSSRYAGEPNTGESSAGQPSAGESSAGGTEVRVGPRFRLWKKRPVGKRQPWSR